MIQQFDYIKKRECRGFRIFENCKSWFEKVARGFSDKELELINEAVRYQSFRELSKRRNDIEKLQYEEE